MIETLLMNPITLWLRWLFTKLKYAIKYLGKNLRLKYMVEVKDCKFGHYNTIYKYSIVRYSEIGDYSYIARDSKIEHTKIGKFCCIGPNVKMGLGIHPSSSYVSSHPLFYSTKGQSSGLVIVNNNKFTEYQKTLIGNDVWIGANVTIKSGVKIGDGVIIATGSVVTKDVEAYSIVGGVPAKLIKYRFIPQQINFLLNFKWWNKDLNWIKNEKELFENIDLMMEKYKSKNDDK